VRTTFTGRAIARAAVLAAVALGACTPVGVSGPHGLHAWTQPDTVRIGMWEEPHTLNPVISTMTFEDDVYQLEYDGLIRYDDHGHAIPDLAREIPTLANGGISRDGRTFTYHLMPNARWHDGAPVTAADVIFTWHQIMNPANNTITRSGYDRIVAMDAPDPYTVRVHLRAPYALAQYLFAVGSIGSILPEHLLHRYASLNQTDFDRHPVGSGAYIFRSWSHGGEMRFDANPHYFRGVPKIPHVVLKFIPDQNTMVSALRSHDIDLYYTVSTLQAPSVRSLPFTTFAQTPSINYEHLTFNTGRAPLNDVRVRLALCYAYDQAAVFRTIYHGLGGQGPTAYSPLLLGYDPTIHYYPYDPAKAAALLDAAGWKLGANGLRAKNGVPLAFELSTVAGVKLREELEVYLQNAWRAVGADVTVKNYPASSFFAPAQEHGPLYSGQTDVSIYTSSHTAPDPDVEDSFSPDRLPPAGQNTSFFRNAEMGALIDAGLASYDPVVRAPIYRRQARIQIDNVPEYTLQWEPQITSANVDLRGVKPNPVDSDLWNVADWTFGN
jgi:peptide/nickel transport system substrate-binding protein